MGGSENSGFSPQIIHFFIGISIVFTIHFGVPQVLETPIYTIHSLGLWLPGIPPPKRTPKSQAEDATPRSIATFPTWPRSWRGGKRFFLAVDANYGTWDLPKEKKVEESHDIMT